MRLETSYGVTYEGLVTGVTERRLELAGVVSIYRPQIVEAYVR